MSKVLIVTYGRRDQQDQKDLWSLALTPLMILRKDIQILRKVCCP